MNYNQVFNVDNRKPCQCLDGRIRFIVGSTESRLILLDTKEKDSLIEVAPEDLRYQNSVFEQFQ